MEKEEDIILDMMITSTHSRKDWADSKNALENLVTAHQEHKYYVGMNSIEHAIKAYPRVQKRYFIQYERYTGRCHNPNEINFSNSTTWCLQEAGREDAKDILEVG